MDPHRILNIVLLLALVGTAAYVFHVKKSAEHEAERIEMLKDRIASEKQRISELHAEWSVLDDPARLQRLVDRHQQVLQLHPLSARQITTIADIPMRAGPEPPVGNLGTQTVSAGDP